MEIWAEREAGSRGTVPWGPRTGNISRRKSAVSAYILDHLVPDRGLELKKDYVHDCHCVRSHRMSGEWRESPPRWERVGSNTMSAVRLPDYILPNCHLTNQPTTPSPPSALPCTVVLAVLALLARHSMQTCPTSRTRVHRCPEASLPPRGEWPISSWR